MQRLLRAAGGGDTMRGDHATMQPVPEIRSLRRAPLQREHKLPNKPKRCIHTLNALHSLTKWHSFRSHSSFFAGVGSIHR